MTSSTNITASKPLVWGILGAARIAGKSLIPAFRGAGAEVRAVAASNVERARAFAKEHSIPRIHDDYASLLADPEIEAVYLPLANGLHKEWAIRCAQAGKPCLCEKPLVMTERDASEIAAEFDRARVVLHEAFMWRHYDQMTWIVEHIRAGEIGELRDVHAHFSFTMERPEDYRWRADQGGGAFWDIGCYPINAARFFHGCEPVAGSMRAHFRPCSSGAKGARVDESAMGWLDFGGNKSATFSCSFVASFAQGIELVGTKARAWIPRPWLQIQQPTRIMIEENDVKRFQEFPPMNAYVGMIGSFTKAVRNSAPLALPAENGVAQARVMEGLSTSANQDGSLVKF